MLMNFIDEVVRNDPTFIRSNSSIKGYYFEQKICSKIALENCYFTVQNTIEQLSIKVITYVEKVWNQSKI